MSKLTVYVGAYTRRMPHVDGRGEGIYRLRLDADTGALAFDGIAARMTNAAFLAANPEHSLLYAVSEVDNVAADQPGGALHAFAIDAGPGGGALLPLNWQPTAGQASCHVAIDATGKYVLTANYNGGNVTVLPIGSDGRVGSIIQLVAHTGAGPDPARQQGPHPHGVYFDLTGRYLLVPDLGIDKVCVYRFDAERGILTPNDPPWAVIHPSAGPRHLAQHPSGRWIYCINELDVTVSVLAFDPASGALAERDWVSLLPPHSEGSGPQVPPCHSEGGSPKNLSAAEIAIAPAGRFAYASIRGHDSIAILAVAPDGGLALIGHELTRGLTPRHFALSPDGRLLIAANQDSDSLVTFHVDADTGRLTPTGHSIAVPSPACALFLSPFVV